MFTIKAQQDGAKYDIEGTVTADGGPPVPGKIVITDARGGVIADVKTVDKVPADHLEKVKKLLEGVNPKR
jgi:hypothetical protein